MLVLGAVNFFIYAPSLTTGFFADDYNFLEPVVRLDPIPYLIRYFDPRLQTLWYRPMQGVLILIEYWFFGSEPLGYHILNVVFHIVNCFLLFALVARYSRNTRLGFLSALFYATFPVYALAVNWINITDPLLTNFFLLGIWFWLNYLERNKFRDYAITLGMFFVAILIKQIGIMLAPILFASDYLLLRNRFELVCAVRRHAAFVVFALGFVLVQYMTQSTHVFASVFGYSPGAQIISITVQYYSLLVFPWGYFPPTDTQITEGMPFADSWNLIWLAIAVGLYVFLTIRLRSRLLVYLALCTFLTLLLVLPFPFVELRYLYLPTMVSAILLALLSEHAFRSLQSSRWVHWLAAVAIGLIILGDSSSVASANAGLLEIARQRRVPFRDISRQHPSFPDDTHLYFIDSVSPLSELSGMFLMRYGRGVTVGGNDSPKVTRPRDHKNAYIYYFDAVGKPHEVAVEQNSPIQPALRFPVNYAGLISLDYVEIAQSKVKRGDVLIAILYWHATAEIVRDYVVFVHFIDKDGKILAGYDSQPRSGKLPTLQWQLYVPVADPIVLPIPSDVPLGNEYLLEFGLYFLPTNERLAILDATGARVTDSFAIQPLSIVE